MSGSSLDGLDIAYTHFQETGGVWNFEIVHADCIPYSEEWINQLQHATSLPAMDYQLLHTAYGHYTGEQVNRFVAAHELAHKVDLIASHGHTTFHAPLYKMTAQLGDGAAIAAVTGLPVITDLRAMDIAFGGQGAPIVPIGEKLLLSGYDLLLNIGGIANISSRSQDGYTAFDICAANRVLNMLASQAGLKYDENGKMASAGNTNNHLLLELNSLEYYTQPYPKSLANDFGTGTVFPVIGKYKLRTEDSLSTYVEHICSQVKSSVKILRQSERFQQPANAQRMLVTGGGAFNVFLIDRLQEVLAELNIEIVNPDDKLINFKEAMIMSLIGVLRWREEYNVLASVTGATRNTIGGALWLGGEA